MKRKIMLSMITLMSFSSLAHHSDNEAKIIGQVSERVDEMTTIILNNSCRFDNNDRLVNQEGCRDTIQSMKSRLEDTNSYPEVIKRLSEFEHKYLFVQD